MKSNHYLCVICNKKAELHHIKSRGSGGPDATFNLIPICRRHHQEVHMNGQITFIKKYPAYEKMLKIKGWYILDGKLLNDELLAKTEDTL